MLLINIFFYVVRNVVRKSLIFQKESSHLFVVCRRFRVLCGRNVGGCELLKGREISGISFFFGCCVGGNFFEDVGVSFLLTSSNNSIMFNQINSKNQYITNKSFSGFYFDLISSIFSRVVCMM